MTTGPTGLVVLAAGRGRRFGRPKAEIVLDRRRLVDRTAQVAVGSGAGPVAVVTRPGVGLAAGLEGVTLLANPAADTGQRSSLGVAVAWAEQVGVAALGVLLVDQPGVGSDAVARVAAAWRPGRAARALYADGPGHPLVMGLAHWHEALALAAPDEGARAWLHRHADLLDAIAVAGSAVDLDTPADLAAWQDSP